MRIIRSILVAFSLYSRIPMPSFSWEEEDMKHVIAFLPLVGAIIGALQYGLIWLSEFLSLPDISRVLLMTALPIVVTGGFHLDGFMDVSDAGNSFKDREEKLKIMKDPHIGAFAVISLAVYGLLWISFLLVLATFASNIKSGCYLIFCAMFCYVRTLCGISSVFFPKAKKDGMLNMEIGNGRLFDKVFLIFQAIISAVFMMWADMRLGLLVVAGLFIWMFYYNYSMEKKFGGVTGDTAGYFIVMGEGIALMLLVIGVVVI